MTTKATTTRALAVVASAAVVCVGLIAPGGAAAATRSKAVTSHFAKVGTRYTINQPICAATPKPGSAACDAMRLVGVSQSTPGAHRDIVSTAYPVGPAGGYTPGDFATAYGFNPASTVGKTQTIALVDAYDDPDIATDLGTFDAEYGLPAETTTSFRKVGETGSASALPTPDTTGWSVEEALDVETARGVCHLCNIILVEADSTSDADLAAGVKTAVKLGATEVSNSYGGPEDSAWTASQRAQEEAAYNFPGVVITASTGDDGWFSWDKVNPDFASSATSFPPSAGVANTPATLPDVVAVGGTTLGLSSSGTRSFEYVWNENGFSDQDGGGALAPQGASGGGCSVIYPAPAWQASVPGYGKTGCGKDRLAADVSADADPNSGFDIITTDECGTDCHGAGSWETIGGTSLASPLIASMWALAGGSGKVAYPALSLYGHSIAKSPPLFDIVDRGNSWCDQDPDCAAHTQSETGEPNPNDVPVDMGHSTVGTVDCGFVRNSPTATAVANDHQCEAAKGYDGPSGVGTPIGLSLFKALNPKASVHAPKKVTAKSKAKFTAGVSDPFPGGTITKYVWKWGDGRKSSGKAKSAVHTYKKAGHFKVTLTATDRYGRTATVAKKITVRKPPKKHHKK